MFRSRSIRGKATSGEGAEGVKGQQLVIFIMDSGGKKVASL